MQQRADWPAWRYGPRGESRIFQNEQEVPSGWTRRPGNVQDDPAESTGSGLEDLRAEIEGQKNHIEQLEQANEQLRQQITGMEQGGETLRARIADLEDERQHLLQQSDELAQKREFRENTDTNADHASSIPEIAAALESGAVTVEQVEAAEQKREKPRAGVQALIEKHRTGQPPLKLSATPKKIPGRTRCHP